MSITRRLNSLLFAFIQLIFSQLLYHFVGIVVLFNYDLVWNFRISFLIDFFIIINRAAVGVRG